jgi:hypothetical protein
MPNIQATHITQDARPKGSTLYTPGTGIVPALRAVLI